ncbi:hypothetical protein [Hoeflea ulvae]|uniref:Uncharacterized protein n=1 Tax=Hoeflea ulvae TaxID=2983764 RepID=A0ABT3YGD2_9HYPH|nr:hypothetical protein [Hoeflea ulvae]MCY0094697.1 hypothetical protein [Hoeflea ulvae]
MNAFWPNNSSPDDRTWRIAPMTYPAPKMLFLLAGLIPAMVSTGFAQDVSALAETVPDRVLFVTSGGFWQDQEEPEAADAAPETGEAPSEAADAEQAAPPARGYYRLIAIRGEDNRSLVYLQQIALTPEGPEASLTIGLDELNTLGGYVTDIRPEDLDRGGQSAGLCSLCLSQDRSQGGRARHVGRLCRRPGRYPGGAIKQLDRAQTKIARSGFRAIGSGMIRVSLL